MGEVAKRTLPIIATEINSIKDQTRKLILCSSIEIGRRLMEAKALLPHGEWGKWLKESVDYSQSTANYLMRVFEEYGAGQTVLFGDNAKSQALGNLSYTQAVALLGVPTEEREQFIQDHDLDQMSTRELQAAIQELKKERERERERAEKAEERAQEQSARADQLATSLEESRTKAAAADDLEEENEALKAANKHLYETMENERTQAEIKVEKLRELIEQSKSTGSDSETVKQLETALAEARQQVAELTEKINTPVTVEAAVVFKIPEDVERELAELREKAKRLEGQAPSASKPQDAAALKYSIYFETVVSGFNNLLSALANIENQETKEKYAKAAMGLLGKMTERLENDM